MMKCTVRGPVSCSGCDWQRRTLVRSWRPITAVDHRRAATATRSRRGFTLIETALAIVIVGTGVLAIMYAQSAFHQQNDWSTHTSAGTFLANELREMTVRLPRHDPVTGRTYWGPEDNETTIADFDDLDDFDGEYGQGLIFSHADGNGPINAMREIIPNMDGWAQIIRVFNVEESDISAPGDPDLDGTTDVMRVEVVVTYQSATDPDPVEITRVSWISRR